MRLETRNCSANKETVLNIPGGHLGFMSALGPMPMPRGSCTLIATADAVPLVPEPRRSSCQ
jgi:hypothetical protein